MSTIAFSTTAQIPARATTRLRLTARGRRLLLAAASVPVAAAIAFGILSGGSALASNDGGASATFETVTVAPGESLWSIASSIAPDEDPRVVISEIRALNALSASTLQIGDEIAIPAQYTK
ncbi:LysM peptidoglycan-binding domain-containing protein [Microbacterium sp.]|uniref:LysM peptidoglycan-binding domain-containing protein n=1 Tax=Microbacterium sp. TaxID=51671 RepID=UPI0039E352CF